MKKPYYNPETGETYRKVRFYSKDMGMDIVMTYFTGSVEMTGSPFYNRLIKRNELGHIIKETDTATYGLLVT